MGSCPRLGCLVLGHRVWRAQERKTEAAGERPADRVGARIQSLSQTEDGQGEEETGSEGQPRLPQMVLENPAEAPGIWGNVH